MSTREPEVTPSFEANSMPVPTFPTVFRGYDPGQVSEYLRAVAGRARLLEDRAKELESELEQVRRQGGSSPGDPYVQISELVVEAVRAFDENVKRMRSEAESQARTIVDDARAKAELEAQNAEELRQQAMAEVEGMLPEAQAEADRIREDAQAEADRIRVDAQARAEEVRAEAERALADAQAQADAVLSELASRRESLVAELR